MDEEQLATQERMEVAAEQEHTQVAAEAVHDMVAEAQRAVEAALQEATDPFVPRGEIGHTAGIEAGAIMEDAVEAPEVMEHNDAIPDMWGMPQPPVAGPQYTQEEAQERLEAAMRRLRGEPEPASAPQGPPEPIGTMDEPSDQSEEPSIWVRMGFEPQLARVCEELVAMNAQDYLPAELREIVDRVKNAKTIEEIVLAFDDRALQVQVETVRQRLPEFNRDVMGFVSQVVTAKPMAVDVDFI